MARIWRAYLNSEVSDGFGPIPALDAFRASGRVRQCRSDLYFYSQRTKGAEAALDPSIDMSPMSLKTLSMPEM